MRDKIFAFEYALDCVESARKNLQEKQNEAYTAKMELINSIQNYLSEKYKDNPEDYPLTEGEQICEIEFHNFIVITDEGLIKDIKPLNAIVLKEFVLEKNEEQTESEIAQNSPLAAQS